MDGNLHLLCREALHIHISIKGVPPHYRCSRGGTLLGAGSGSWDLQQRIVAQHRSRARSRAQTSSRWPLGPSGVTGAVPRLVQHGQSVNPSAMLQTVPQWFGRTHLLLMLLVLVFFMNSFLYILVFFLFPPFIFLLL